jgi:hypothetical protein
MPSRVRIIGSHANYGVNYGGRLIHYIEDSWQKKYRLIDLNQIVPLGFQAWAHWKRALWLAKNEGFWVIKAFREPREARISRSLYGVVFREWGIAIPRRKQKKLCKVGVKQPKIPQVKANRIYFAGRDNFAVDLEAININDVMRQGQGNAVPARVGEGGINGNIGVVPLRDAAPQQRWPAVNQRINAEVEFAARAAELEAQYHAIDDIDPVDHEDL